MKLPYLKLKLYAKKSSDSNKQFNKKTKEPCNEETFDTSAISLKPCRL